MTILCLSLASFFKHIEVESQKAFMQKFMKLLKLVPGFVAAWAWQALGQAIASENWPKPTDTWSAASRQLTLVGFEGICVLGLLMVSVIIQSMMIFDERVVEEVFGAIGGCNVGWAWKQFVICA
jgi:hypothetical protein